MTTKKPSSLAEQVREAQLAVSGWSETKRASLHLEGVDVFLGRKQSNVPVRTTHQPHQGRRKIAA